jgi:Mce-associated membrane protein
VTAQIVRPTAWSGRTRWLVAALVLVLAAAFAGWSAWSAVSAGRSDDLAVGTARDQVLAAGRADIAALDSMDYRNPDAGLNRWLGAATGPLHDQLQRDRAHSRQQIVAGRTVAVGTVLAAAVTQVNAHDGTAELIASVSIALTPAGGSATTQRNRYRAALTRTADGWKLSSLTAIPVSAG